MFIHINTISLLRRNLPGAVVMVKVLGFNMKTAKKKMDFEFTETDLEQFRVRFKSNSNIYQADILGEAFWC